MCRPALSIIQRQRMTQRRDQNLCFDGFVLVGGASSRMGRDKAQIILGDQKLFERAAAVLSEICSGSISLVGGQSGRLAASTDLVVAALPDLRIAGQNASRASILGLYTALVNAKTEWIAVLACDLPFVTADLLTKLVGYCSDEFDAVVPIQPDGRPQPLCAFYWRERCLPVVEECLKTGDLKVQRLLSQISTRYVEFDEIAELDGSSNFFLNINMPEDYETALAIAAR